MDLIAEPDLSGYRWKDEHARRLGLIDDRVHRRVAEARQEVVGLIETRRGAGSRPSRFREPCHQAFDR
ncbi:hypothetical protein [Nonomuraea sp. GTA35]|uniref:hypothetical protein n=1 Tax=Nonomuraea sp. GTA35 TaxID=1676746 RepID=UPI0035C19863